MPDSLRFLSVYLVTIGIRYNRYIEKTSEAQESSQILHDFSQKKTQQGAKNLDKARRNVYKCKVRFAGMTKKTKRIHVRRYKLGGIYDE